MPTALRRLQWIGILLVVVSAALPAFAWKTGRPFLPGTWVPTAGQVILVGEGSRQRTPAVEVGRGVMESLGAGAGGGAEALWRRRPIYAYALVPFWILGLLMARRHRRAAGALLWLLTLGVVVLEALYLQSDYRPFFPKLLGSLETGIAWCVVCAMLVFRRPADRQLGAVESTVAAQALLAFVHGLTLPCTHVRDYVDHLTFAQLAERVGDAFAPGFWIGMAGFLLIAIPGYVGSRSSGVR
ncbi:MAG: hypothetical protein QNJ98_00615 [Planctomycetota bacterium]|nr:hypothetical protein [Planctomycetota bacterium]